MSVQCKCGTYRRYGDEIAGRQVAKAMHEDACVNCGYIPPKSSILPKKRIGDVVSESLDYIGVTKVVKAVEKATGRDCGCNKRREFLNKIDEKVRG